MSYGKKDALMTRGLAILTMVVLHLFCRRGADVYGTPLIWINEDTPLVYWFGFFSEICVALYSICAGYAQGLLSERNQSAWKDRLHRIGKLLLNYWIVVVLFSILGLLFDETGEIPGSWLAFLGNLVLLRQYNGAWWYLHTYVIMLLIPTRILLWPIRKRRLGSGLVLCFVLDCAWYAIRKTGLLPDAAGLPAAGAFLLQEAENLAGILPYVWVGAIFCRKQGFERLGLWWEQNIESKQKNWILLLAAGALFAGVCILHKSILIGPAAMLVFILFNIWEKNGVTAQVFCFLGRHSTNIWLTHMFFYLCLFPGLVQRAKYPIFMLAYMLSLCIAASYVIQAVEQAIERVLHWGRFAS